MNVNYSDTVTDTVRSLRESVSATETKCVPEQVGGWSVNITTDKENIGVSTQESRSYLGKISDALTSSIHTVDRSVNYSKISPSNLANVVVTGENSITVKL